MEPKDLISIVFIYKNCVQPVEKDFTGADGKNNTYNFESSWKCVIHQGKK